MAERALEQASLDEVWFLPAAVAPHKPEGSAVGAQHRCRMLELALAGQPGLVLCRHEVEQGRARRSVDTLSELRRRHPRVAFFFLMGEDSFRALDEWMEPERLVAMAPPLVQPRPGGAGERPERYAGQAVQWLEGEEIDVSSTEVREQLNAERWAEAAEALAPAVLEYVRRHGLYADGGPR